MVQARLLGAASRGEAPLQEVVPLPIGTAYFGFACGSVLTNSTTAPSFADDPETVSAPRDQERDHDDDGSRDGGAK
jgi:hypothetical protein